MTFLLRKQNGCDGFISFLKNRDIQHSLWQKWIRQNAEYCVKIFRSMIVISRILKTIGKWSCMATVASLSSCRSIFKSSTEFVLLRPARRWPDQSGHNKLLRKKTAIKAHNCHCKVSACYQCQSCNWNGLVSMCQTIYTHSIPGLVFQGCPCCQMLLLK